MSGSRTITVEDGRLPNVHPGDILREDFLIGTEVSVAEVANGAHIDLARLAALVASEGSVDADIDLRLGRYFGMSPGFFLGLQADFDLEEISRANGPELDRIVPRAA